ncbi:MAG: prepilin-type N-terminal cleavage/methylation domain-containing protein [Kiritimatiellae bacterium]|nr:prepilin-type N-terminal cleavage/methylation domain-containing protein [Kiritimatiellia bacterium]
MTNLRRGFTLIEVLLAVGILGIVAGVVATTLSTAVEVWRQSKIIADRNHHGDAVMEQVVMSLRSAYYPEGTEPSYEYGFSIEDDGNESPNARDKLSWVKIGSSLIGEDVPWAGSAHRVELFVEDGGENQGIYVKAWQLVGLEDDFDPEEDVEPILLSDEVVSLNCRMIDPDKTLEPLDEIEWLDEWAESNRIPTKVEITIAIQQKGSREEPTEYVRTVEIPMAKLSWDLVDTSKGKKNARGNNNKNQSNKNSGSTKLNNSNSGNSSGGGKRPSSGGGAGASGGGGKDR